VALATSRGSTEWRTVGNFEWLAGEDATPSEGSRLEAGHASLEAGLGGGTALLVPAERTLGCADGAPLLGDRAGRTATLPVRIGVRFALAAHVSFCSGARLMYSKSCGGKTSMFGVTP
jgi:hypothetical protein